MDRRTPYSVLKETTKLQREVLSGELTGFFTRTRLTMMSKFLTVIVATFACYVTLAVCQDPTCVGRPDLWTVEIGCWGYKFCNSSKMVEIVNCTSNGTVYDRENKTCITPGQGTSECGNAQPCIGKLDGYYPDLTDKCISYYVCAGEVSLGRLYCAAHLVFNEKTESCDWLSNVPPPCGNFHPA